MMEEEDKVGEIDFDFDLSDWMVLDDDATSEDAIHAQDSEHEEADSSTQSKLKEQDIKSSEKPVSSDIATKTSPAQPKKDVTSSVKKSLSATPSSISTKAVSTPLKVKSEGSGKKTPAQSVDKKRSNAATVIHTDLSAVLSGTESKSSGLKSSLGEKHSSIKPSPTSYTTKPKKSIKANEERSAKNSSLVKTTTETLKTTPKGTKDSKSSQQQSATPLISPKGFTKAKTVKGETKVGLSKTTTATPPSKPDTSIAENLKTSPSTPKTVNVTSSPKPKLATSLSKPTTVKEPTKTIVQPKKSEIQPQVLTVKSDLKFNATAEKKDDELRSLAEVLEAVDKQNVGGTLDDDIEDISDTELIVNPEVKSLIKEEEKAKVVGEKRKSLASTNEPAVKKPKVAGVKATSLTGAAAPKNVNVVAKNKKSMKQQGSNVTKTQTTKSKSPVVSVAKICDEITKDQTPNTITAASTPTNAQKSKPQTPSTPNSTPVKKTVKRIIRRFHRTTQTEIRQYKNKLLQCLIRIPSLDAPPKPMSDQDSQTNPVKEKKLNYEVYHQMPLPDTLRQDVFGSVAAFSVNKLGPRQLGTASFPFGISFGPVTCSDIDKSSFRENILRKSDYYNTFFDGQNFGVVDLLFSDEENFSSMITQIRKTRIGSRHLVVTFCKNLSEEERDSTTPVLEVRATVIFDQNFSSTGFLKFQKAPVWSKPKVEETVSIHNLPGGIPLDFLKLLIPDAITMEVDDEKHKFTKDNSQLQLGITRKDGGDNMLELFCQMYVNSECLVLTKSYKSTKELPEMEEILIEKEQRKKEEQMKMELHLRELTAVPRDINKGIKEDVDQEDEAEVIMHVENMDAEEIVLRGRAAAWKGASSSSHLKQVLKQQSMQADPLAFNTSDLALSEVSLSDISDNSDFGEKLSPVKRYPLKTVTSTGRSLSRGHRAPSWSSAGNGSSRSQRSSKRNSWHRALSRERTDERRDLGLRDDMRHRSPPKRSLDRNSHGRQFAREDGTDNRSHDSFGRSRDDRDRLHWSQERYGAEHSFSAESREEKSQSVQTSEKQESARERLRRERLELVMQEKARQMRWSSHKKERLKQSDQSSEKGERWGRDGRRESAAGSGRDRRENSRDGDSFMRRSQNALSSVDKYGKERDTSRDRIRRGSRGGSSEFQRSRGRGGGDDERRVVRTRSPLTLQIVRRGSANPRRSHSPNRRISGTLRKVTIVRRSVSPRSSYPRGSSLSPISVGDDTEGEDQKKGTWRSGPQDLRKAGKGSSTSNNLVPVHTERKPPGTTETSEELDTAAFRVQLENFLKEAIAISMESAESQGPSNKTETPQYIHGFHDPVKFLEKMRGSYGSGVSFTDSGSGIGVSGASNTVATGQEDTRNTTQSLTSYGDGWQDRNVQTSQDSGKSKVQGMSCLNQHPSNFPPPDLSLPPPIPPPVMPPLFTPVASSNDRMSQMEALAKQLAVDIQRQQPNQQHSQPCQQQSNQPPPGGMWGVPPNMAALPGPQGPVVTHPVHSQAPPVMVFPGQTPFPRLHGPIADAQPPIRHPNLGPAPDMLNPPWPPGGNFF